MRLSLFILFIAAFASQTVLIFAYWIVGMNPNQRLNWSALALSGMCVTLMVVIAMASRNVGTRWLTVGLIGMVTLAFSALTIISIGLLTAPFAFALVVLSIVMLIRHRRKASAWE